MATMKRVLAFITASRLPRHSNVSRGGHKYLLALAVFALSFFASTSSLNAYDSPDSTSESEQQQLRPSYPCIPMWEPVPSPFTPIWVPDWNTWIPAFSPDALTGIDGVSTARVGLPGWQPWNPLPPCRYPWPPLFTPIPWEPFDPPTQSQAIYLGSGTSLVDGAGAVCTPAGVDLLAATGQTGFSIPFPATSFPAFGGHTHLTSPTPGGTYLNTLYSWHKISLSIVQVNGGAGTPIERYNAQASQTTEYIVYDADGTALRFRVENGQIKPAFGVYAELIQLGDTFAVVGGPPSALNQKGAWVYFFTGASPGAYAWGSAPKARVLAIRDPSGNYWHTARDPNNSRWVVWKSPNSVYLAFDPETGYVYYSANTNPPQWQPLGKTPGVLSSGDPRGSDPRERVIYWGDPSDPQGHIAYQWSVDRLPPATTRITLEAGYLGSGGVFVSQAKKAWLFGDDSNGYTNGRNERDLYAAMYGEVPANLYGRLYEQLWGTVSKTKLEYYPAAPFGVQTKIYRENLNQDYTLLRHIDGDSDKKFNKVEVERPRFDGSGVSLERVVLSPTNGQPVLREFFEWRDDRLPNWQEQYEYNYPADPLALTGYVDRQGNRYQWEYQQLSTGIPWRDGRAEQETVLTRAVDPTGVEVSLQYGEEYTIPPWQVVRQNPPTIPSSVQLGRNSERRWRFGYTYEAGSQRSAPNGLLLGFKEPERGWWRFGYTSLSHPHPYQLAQITDPTERFSRITAWDAFGRPTRSEVYPYQGAFGWDTNRPVWQEIEYDPVGRVRAVQWGYDERGRRYLSGSVRYNWVGHLLAGFTDARGRQVRFEYDPFRLGLLSEIKINGQRYAALGYDWHGRLTSVVGGNGVGVEYTYTYRDALQTIRHTGDPTPEEFRYSDCCGQVSFWKRQDGQQLFFDYTLNGWLREVRYKGVGDLRSRTLYTYDYDPAGRLTVAQSEISTVNYTYDTTDGDRTGWLERTDTTLANNPYTFDYSYYLNGDLRGFSWRRQGALPFSTQQFTYDDAGRLATQSYALGGIGSQIGLMVDYAYDGAGRLAQQRVQVQVGAQQRTLTTSLQYADYWSIGSVWTQSVLLDGRTVANYAYSYYEDGTLSAAFEQHAEPNGSSSQRQLGWDYYPDGSLQYERIGSQQRNFQYDLGGNMTDGVPAAPTLTAQYEYNQLRSLGNWTFSYNPNGERVGERNAPDGTREYGYDGFGNLIWVKRGGQLVYEARYDALGRRVAYRTSSRDSDWVYLLYDGDMLVAELDANGQVRAEYVWGSLGPVARIAGGRVQLYVCDALGHVRALIDAETGQITDRYDYDAWGNVVHNGSTRQPFTWNGAYGYEWMPFAWDRAPGYDDTWRFEIGLYHVGARAYDPRTARWLQRDPIDAASGDPNLYRYCGNDPINRVDIDGSNSEEKHPNNSAGKKAKDKTQQKVAFVCVGDTDLGNPIANLALAARLAGELWAIQRALEQQGYTVIVDRDCTEEEAINALKDESIKAFVFIGHANEYELGMYGEGNPVLDVDEVRSALGGRKLERVDLRGCHTDSPAWREAFGNPDSFDGIKGLYNPVFGIDWGNLLGDKKPPSKKKREGTPKGRKRPN